MIAGEDALPAKDYEEHAFVKIWACGSLGKLGDRSGVPVMMDVLRNKASQPFRGNVIACLQGITGLNYTQDQQWARLVERADRQSGLEDTARIRIGQGLLGRSGGRAPGRLAGRKRQTVRSVRRDVDRFLLSSATSETSASPWITPGSTAGAKSQPRMVCRRWMAAGKPVYCHFSILHGGAQLQEVALEPGKSLTLYSNKLTLWPLALDRAPEPGTLFVEPGKLTLSRTDTSTLSYSPRGVRSPAG